MSRSCRERNIYGYIFNSVSSSKVPSPSNQLRNLLKLSMSKFRPLKKNIVRLMEKHLDIDRKSTDQLDKVLAIENELKELHPEIFTSEESKKRLYFATHLVFNLHAGRRTRFKKRNKNLTAPTTSSQTHSRSNIPSMNIDPDVTCTIHDPNRYRDIHTFLETSVPSMTHLMDAFIDFGCINADFLLAISSWSIERIRDVLDQLSLGPNGKRISEMDKFILENHFKEYFIQHGMGGNSMQKPNL